MPSVAVATAIVLWSSLGVFVRLLGIDVEEILFYSAAFSLPLHAAVIFSTGLRRKIPPFTALPYVFILSLTLLLNTFTFLFAYKKTTVANAVLTHYIAPVLVAIMGAVFLKERITRRVILSLALATLGLWVMLGISGIIECIGGVFLKGLRVTPDMLGIISGLASGLFYAILILLIRVFAQRFNPYTLVFVQNIFVALMLMPFVEIVNPDKLPLLMLMALLHSTVAPYLYYFGLSRLQAHRAAILGYLEPLGAIIFSVLLLSEYPALRVYIGGILIIVSGYLTITEER